VVKNGFQSPAECPVCGETVPRGARACPGCGADERSGWNEDATRYDGLDLPDGAFASDDSPAPAPASAASKLWIGVAAVLLVVLILVFLR